MIKEFSMLCFFSRWRQHRQEHCPKGTTAIEPAINHTCSPPQMVIIEVGRGGCCNAGNYWSSTSRLGTCGGGTDRSAGGSVWRAVSYI